MVRLRRLDWGSTTWEGGDEMEDERKDERKEERRDERRGERRGGRQFGNGTYIKLLEVELWAVRSPLLL